MYVPATIVAWPIAVALVLAPVVAGAYAARVAFRAATLGFEKSPILSFLAFSIAGVLLLYVTILLHVAERVIFHVLVDISKHHLG